MSRFGNSQLAVCALAFACLACRDGRQQARHDEPSWREAVGDRRADTSDTWAPKPNPPVQDYADARRSFRTKLLREESAPQDWAPVKLASDAREIEYESGGRKLKAWLSRGSKSGTARGPAVLFLHGGFAFGAEDWDMAKPFRDAGYVVMMPMLRGENGQRGAFSLFYDEVDDVLAAAGALAKRPEVDATRIYVIGHSVGGTLAMLSALSSTQFRAMVSMSGAADLNQWGFDGELPFDPREATEIRMRSALEFAMSFKCPARLYWGNQERGFAAMTKATARRAKAAGLDVEAAEVAGDHMEMTVPAIKNALGFFEQQR